MWYSSNDNKNQGSQPVHKVKVDRNVSIPMRDGVRLSADIFRPDAEGKFPALLAMCPYSKDILAPPIPPQPSISPLWKGDLESGNSEYFVSRGYAHVVADIRGTGNSEGAYLNMFSRKEQEDGYDLIEWIAQQDWCDGNIGMVGISYFACIQYLVAAQQPPHLKAIFPLDGWGDLYRDIVYHGGILNIGFFAPFLWEQIAATSNLSAMSEETTLEEMKKLVQRSLSNEDIKINPWLNLILTNPQKNPMMFDFLLNPNDGPFYHERSGYTKYDKIKVPTFCGSRWDAFRIHLPGAFSSYSGINAPKKLIITPRSYERPWYEYHDLIIRWYDYWLKGIDNGIMKEPPIKIFVRGTNKWREESEWPLERTRWVKFYLGSWERLLPEPGIYYNEPPYGDQPDCFVHQSPVVTSNIQSLRYFSPPMPDDIEITGPIVLYIYASIDTDDTNWIVKVKDVDENGGEIPLTEGWLKASHRAIDPDRSRFWQPFHTHTDQPPIVPGEIYEYAIEIRPISNIIRSNHLIKLEIMSSDFSGFYMHMDNPLFYHLPKSKITVHKIFHDKEHPSYLLLPIIPRT